MNPVLMFGTWVPCSRKKNQYPTPIKYIDYKMVTVIKTYSIDEFYVGFS